MALAATVEADFSKAAGNTTILNTEIAPAWVNAPPFRGTADILWSCTVTITACVYTAMHMNIPPPHKSKWVRMTAKVKWALVTLFAPELVIHNALKQYRAAQQVCARLNGLRERKRKQQDAASLLEAAQQDNLQSPTENFDLTYGFWVVMGGFVIDTKSIHDTFSRATLTPEGVELLAKKGHFLEISKEEITDRSKANILAKSLVCAQVTWMLIQCIARKAAGYPLTILEIHTMVHVFCALCIYLLWWHKPLDVQEPMTINGTAYLDILALMLMASFPTENGAHSEIYDLQMYTTESDLSDESIGISNETPASATLNADAIQRHSSNYQRQAHNTKNSPEAPKVIQHFNFKDNLQVSRTTSKPKALISLQYGQSLQCGLGPSPFNVSALSSKDVRRWKLAAEAMKKLDVSLSCGRYGLHWSGSEYAALDQSLSLGAENIPSMSVSNQEFRWTFKKVFDYMDEGSTLISASIFLPLIYGGVHLTAWNFTFPSTAEQMIWRIAVIGIMVATYVEIFLVCIVLSFLEPLNKFVDGALDGTFDVFSNTSLWLMTGFYILCRGYIVFEAFLSLRHVPVGVYAAIPWVQTIPHI